MAVVLIMVLLNFSPLITSAGSVWRDDGKSFAKGTLTGLQLFNGDMYLATAGSKVAWEKIGTDWPDGLIAPAYGSYSAGIMVVFGGMYSNVRNDTWYLHFGNHSWEQKYPANPPAARYGAAMAFDSTSSKFVLFGGDLNVGGYPGPLSNETWSYDPVLVKWTKMSPTSSPKARSYHTMAFDPGTARIILYGGVESHGAALCDTWSYDLKNDAWTEVHPSPNPGPRTGHAMVYMGTPGTILLVGNGLDTWMYKASTQTWTKKGATIPYALDRIAATYDLVKNEVVMLAGGADCDSNKDVYIYNVTGDKWSTLNLATSPGYRESPSMAYDSGTTTVAVFAGDHARCMGSGGGGWIPPNDDMWLYDRTTGNWTHVLRGPVGAHGQAMAWVPTHGSAFMLGGMANGYSLRDSWMYGTGNQTWYRKNWTWSAGYKSAIAYDSKRDNILSFAGFSGYGGEAMGQTSADLERYNFTTDEWKQLNPTGPSPPRMGHGFVYDKADDRFILFGGYSNDWGPITYYANTSVYDPILNKWTALSLATEPSPRTDFAMVYADSTGEVILFGGVDKAGHRFSDVWTFNYTKMSWTNITPTVSPYGWSGMASAYDTKTNRLMVFGGIDDHSGVNNDIQYFSLDTKQWGGFSALKSPSKRTEAAMVYDPLNDGFLMFGGNDGNYKCDTWMFHMTDWVKDGTYISQPKDLGGEAYFGNISWEGVSPEGTSIKFQVRAADTAQNLSSKLFVGPTGNSLSYFDISGARLGANFNKSRFIQYKAYLSTSNTMITPSLHSTSFDYNLMQSVAMVYPKGGENISGPHNISWNASDKDGDHLHFNVTLEASNSIVTVLANDTVATNVTGWNASAFHNGSYRIKVRSWDDNKEIPLTKETTSGWFDIWTPPPPPPPNHKPMVWLFSPANETVLEGTHVNLSWSGEDQDGDVLNYTLYVSQDRLDMWSNGTVTDRISYTLNGTGTYFWTVIPNDGKDNGTCRSGIWWLTLEKPPPPPPPPKKNHAPNASLLAPADEAVLHNKTVTLRWDGSDPDNDTLTFRLFVGKNISDSVNRNPKALVVTTKNRSYEMTLEEGTYNWTIVSFDGRLNGTSPGIRSFTIRMLHPKLTCSISLPANGTTVKGPMEVRGSAAAVDAKILVVKVRIDGGPWTNATGVTPWTSWYLTVDTLKLKDGTHKVEAMAFGEGQLSSNIASVTILVKNKQPAKTSLVSTMLPWAVLIAVIATIVSVILYNNHRKRDTGGKT